MLLTAYWSLASKSCCSGIRMRQLQSTIAGRSKMQFKDSFQLIFWWRNVQVNVYMVFIVLKLNSFSSSLGSLPDNQSNMWRRENIHLFWLNIRVVKEQLLYILVSSARVWACRVESTHLLRELPTMRIISAEWALNSEINSILQMSEASPTE